MRTLRHSITVALALLAVLGATVLATKTTAAEKAPKTGKKKDKTVPGADIFDNQHVLPIRIEIGTNELKALQADNRKHVRATVWEGTNVWHDVGVHLKGAAGSFRDNIRDKPALTLSFGKFTPEQKFHGLRKIHLNNSVQDSSFLTENLCGELYRQAGVPAARASYATVQINGKKQGLYVLKEGFTKEMLGLSFKNTKGNLYDGGFLREITDQLERDMGEDHDVADWSDLKALAKAAISPNASTRFEELSKVLDVDRFASYAALQIMTWDWDGYVMNRNNYRIYHDLESGKMVFIPHGMDQMFWQADSPVRPPDKFNGLVASAFIRTPMGRQMYQERFGQIFTNVFQIEMLTNRVNELAALLSPYAGSDHSNQVKRIRDLIVARHTNLQRRLTEPEPTPLQFQSGVAPLTNWIIAVSTQEKGNAPRDKVTVDGRPALHIQATNSTTASWRARVLLETGHYRFEATAKSAGVVKAPAVLKKKPAAVPAAADGVAVVASEVQAAATRPAVDGVVVAVVEPEKKGEGAGIRHAGTQKPRENQLVGDAPWQPLVYEFEVAVPNEEVTLICELRAISGDVWFETGSLKLLKVK